MSGTASVYNGLYLGGGGLSLQANLYVKAGTTSIAASNEVSFGGAVSINTNTVTSLDVYASNTAWAGNLISANTQAGSTTQNALLLIGGGSTVMAVRMRTLSTLYPMCSLR